MQPSNHNSSKPVLRVSGLGKSYHNLAAVKDLSFELRPGEIVGLVGPNGAGKTTTLECILQLRQPDQGTIHIMGLEATRHKRKVKTFVGAQLQSTQLPPAITPLQALKLSASFYTHTLEPSGLLKRFNMESFAHQAFHTLSEGQQRKLCLAMAMIHNPPLLLLDEPTAGLDPTTRHSLHQWIHKRKTQNSAILLSTHLLQEAEKLCDRILLISQGRLIAEGSPDTLVSKASQLSTLHLTLRKTPEDLTFTTIPAIEGFQSNGNTFSLFTRNPDTAIIEVMRLVIEQGNTLVRLDIRKPNLESAYLELTGESWPETTPPPNQP